MLTSRERILIVESDPDISDLIARQALRPLGYDVAVMEEAASALKRAVQTPPDLIVANLNLPGLSGKDLITALTSQGVSTPLVVLAEKGQEADAIQAFRLGAMDVLFWPAHDAEVVRVVERALNQTRETRARQQLAGQLEATNQELQRKVRELTTILAMGKAVMSITDQRQLFDRIVEGALQVSEADLGWLMLRDERTKAFLLNAYRKLPPAWAKKLNQPLDDGISSLVTLSAETLTIHGGPLQKFKVAVLGKSAAVVPLKVQNEVIGLLIVVRKADREIEAVAQSLLEAVADFAAISLVNARLFRALEENAEVAKTNAQQGHAALESLRELIREEMQASLHYLEVLTLSKPGSLTEYQQQALKAVQSSLQKLLSTAEKTIPSEALKER
ncbi:MAG: response regulator [Anaerolineales bacterium]